MAWNPHRTLESHFDPRENCLNLIRLGLAATVIVFHAFALTGEGVAPALLGVDLGGWAVTSFFIISGFLITRSASRRSTRDFFRDRFLRIAPAFVVCLLVVAFVFAPLSMAIRPDHHWTAGGAASYLLHNLALYPPHFSQPGIGSTLSDLPFPGTWNGALWTLFYEGLCYVATGIAFLVLPRRAIPAASLVAMAAFTLALLVVHIVDLPLPDAVSPALTWGLPFTVGAALYLYMPFVPASGAAIAVSIAGLIVICLAGLPIFALPLGPVLLRVGCLSSPRGIANKTDLSYGTYIYGFPVQMLLVLIMEISHTWIPLILDIPITFLITLAFAYFSFILIENPSLRMRSTAISSHATVLDSSTSSGGV